MASDLEGNRTSLSPTVSVTSSTMKQWNTQNEELMGAQETQVNPAAQVTETPWVPTNTTRQTQKRKRNSRDNDDSDDSMQRAAKKLRRVPGDDQSDSDSGSASSRGSQQESPANRRLRSPAKAKLRRHITFGQVETIGNSGSHASSSNDRGGAFGASANNNSIHHGRSAERVTLSLDDILQAAALRQSQGTYQTQVNLPHHDQDLQPTASPASVEPSQDGNSEMTDADDEEAEMTDLDIEDPDDEGSNFGSSASLNDDDQSEADLITPDKIIEGLRQQLKDKDDEIKTKNKIIELQKVEAEQARERNTEIISNLRKTITMLTKEKSQLQAEVRDPRTHIRQEPAGHHTEVFKKQIRNLEALTGKWKKLYTTNTTQKYLARRLKNSKHSAQWSKFAVLNNDKVPVVLTSEEHYGSEAAQEFVEAWICDEVKDIVNRPLEVLNGSFDDGAKTRSSKSEGLGSMMTKFEDELLACGSNPVEMRDSRRATLRKLLPEYYDGAQLPNTLDQQKFVAVRDSIIEKSSKKRTEEFFQKASPVLLNLQGKKLTAAKAELTNIFKEASNVMLHMQTQRSEVTCGADSSTWLNAPFQPGTGRCKWHDTHCNAIKKDKHWVDGRNVVLINRPAFVRNGDKCGDNVDTMSEVIRAATVLLDCA